MRALLMLLVVANALGAMAAFSPAHAWYDRWGRWHPNYDYRRYPPPPYWAYRPPRYYAPPVYAPPPVYYPRVPYYPPPPVYYRPY